jgi:cell division protein FtsW
MLFSRLRQKRAKFALHQQKKRIDLPLLGAVILACGLGLLFIFEASSVSAARDFGDKYHFFRDQSIWLATGFVILALASFFDYHRLYKLALPIIIVAIILLAGVFIPGLGVKALGAHRWLNLKFFIIQPAEAAKLALIIYLAAWFSYKERGRLLAFVILVGIVVGLVVAEPDLGTAVVICAIALALYFLSGAPLWHFGLLIPVVLLSILGLALTSTYRLRRLITFLNPSVDPLGASYHIRQILLALGSGGFWGLGLGKSRQKFEYLPEAMTDSIFAIVGEELGFIGGIALIAIFLFILWRGMRIALFAPDRFGQLLAFGISSWIGVQVIINLGAMVALVPLTGVPLPLISYGGSSLVVTLIGIGILLNISKQCLAQRR